MAGSTLVVLGGGEGSRLEALTEKRAKPAVPFAGNYRIIDFVLSNALNSGIDRVRVLTQYESVSLTNHIRRAWWTKFGDSDFSNLYTLSATLSRDKNNGWYSGTANAVYQNRGDIFLNNPNVINVFGGDHIYYMDISQMNDFHLDNSSDFTVAGRVIKVEDARKRFGVFTVNDRWEALGFEEKPEVPKELPGMPGYCICSMGNYAAKPNVLEDALDRDHTHKKFMKSKEDINNPEKQTTHDFGNDIIPQLFRDGKKIFVYNFMENDVPGQDVHQKGAWWDVGTLGDFWTANMDTLKVIPSFSLYNPEWEVLTLVKYHQPAKVIMGSTVEGSLLCNGVISTGSNIINSIIGPGTRVNKGNIENVIWFGEGSCEENVYIRNAIIDHDVHIPKGTRIGVDKDEDRARGLKVYDQQPNITVVPKGHVF
jgi:glucose-1-phosphate adenylyltransferase